MKNKKDYPLVSIITPAFRAEYFIKDIIKNFSAFKYPNIEVVMVFDPSPDKGVEIARKMTKNKKNWRIIANEDRLGISKCLNLAIEKSRGKYVVFFMTDMYVDPSCVSEQVKFIESADSTLGAVGAKTYDLHHRDLIQAYRMYFLPQTGYLYIPEYGLKDKKKYNQTFEGFSGIDGTLYKKSVLKKVGMFDLDIDSGINDLDLIWRTWLAGFRIVKIPSAKIFHWSLKEGRATEKWEFSYARMIDIFIQNYSLKYLIIYLPQLIAVYSARGLITLCQGNPNPLKGWLQSLYWSARYLPTGLKKRKIIQNEMRMVTDDYLYEKIFSPMSLWEFYKHLKWVQTHITPKILTKEGKNESILTFSK